MSTDEAAPDPAIREDMNKLLGTALGMAQDQLETHGAFLPTALVMANDDEIRMVAVSPGEDTEDLDADAMIADLYEALKAQRNENRAAVVVSDIHLPDEETDAIYAVAEHSKDVGVAAIQAYTDNSGEWTFQDPIWEAAEFRIWEQ